MQFQNMIMTPFLLGLMEVSFFLLSSSSFFFFFFFFHPHSLSCKETKKFADSLPRFDISTLLSLSDEKEMKKMGEMMIEQLNKHGVVVLKLDENYKKVCFFC